MRLFIIYFSYFFGLKDSFLSRFLTSFLFQGKPMRFGPNTFISFHDLLLLLYLFRQQVTWLKLRSFRHASRRLLSAQNLKFRYMFIFSELFSPIWDEGILSLNLPCVFFLLFFLLFLLYFSLDFNSAMPLDFKPFIFLFKLLFPWPILYKYWPVFHVKNHHYSTVNISVIQPESLKGLAII